MSNLIIVLGKEEESNITIIIVNDSENNNISKIYSGIYSKQSQKEPSKEEFSFVINDDKFKENQ